MKQRAQIITVFGSSRPREGDSQYHEARALGAALATSGFVVCSGGYAGVMEAASRGAKEAGGRTIGITSKSLKRRANRWIDQEIQVKSWQDRLFELVIRGDGYVICPGGTGTLAELAVVWEMVNKGVMAAKPLVTIGPFWKPVIECVREVELGHKTKWGEQEGPLVNTASSASEATKYLAQYFSAQPTRPARPRRNAKHFLW